MTKPSFLFPISSCGAIFMHGEGIRGRGVITGERIKLPVKLIITVAFGSAFAAEGRGGFHAPSFVKATLHLAQISCVGNKTH